jgi:hypothetical protein
LVDFLLGERLLHGFFLDVEFALVVLRLRPTSSKTPKR